MPGRRLTETVTVIAAVFGSDIALAQTFPSAPVRIYTSAIGGGTDFAARIMAQGLATRMGQPVIVDNRPPALQGVIVPKSAPDQQYYR